MRAPHFFTSVVVLVALNVTCPEHSPAHAQGVELSERKAQAEIQKLQEEVKQLSLQNASRETPLGQIATVAGIIGGVLGSFVTIVVAFLGIVLPRRFEAARAEKLRQDKELMREQHNLAVFQDLASASQRQQLAAAAILLQRLYAQPEHVFRQQGTYEAIECKTIVDVLVAVIKEKTDADVGAAASATVSRLGKYVADNIVKALHAVVVEGGMPKQTSPLAITDWQGAQLVNVWWERVDARGIDFFQANFATAGLAHATFQNAKLYGACMERAILRHADMRGADLQEADFSGANLIGADLTGAILRKTRFAGARFDATTKWPDGFDPAMLLAPQAA